VFGALFRPENQGLYQRVVAASELLFRPILTGIISQGVNERLFETADPEGVADLLQQLASNTYPFVTRFVEAGTEQEKQDTLKAFHRRLRLNGMAIDRLLGLPDGTLYVPSLSTVKKLMTRLTE
jgi:TetR/AcrR family transcriptional regulator, cholesterol catabolism regulator